MGAKHRLPKNQGFATRTLHAGEGAPRPDFTPTVSPLYRSVSYRYDDSQTFDDVLYGERPGYVYLRYGTPTHTALQTALAELEGAGCGLAVASGMAAVQLALLAAGAGKEGPVLCAHDVYGATFTTVTHLYPKLGIPTATVDITDLEAVGRALGDLKPAVIFCETISNPLMKVSDVPAVVDMAHSVGARVVVDNTFTTPYLFRPMEAGADYVIHSTTKYISGHGDVLGGAVLARAEEDFEKLFEAHIQLGGVMGPDEAWLTMRGLKTLPLRMERQCRNALQLAAWLAEQPQVARVCFPGLPDDPFHATAVAQYRRGCFGAMLSFDLSDGSKEKAYRFLDALKLCLPVVSLGDIYTLVCYPPTTTHQRLTPEEKAQLDIGPSLIRVSVGVEDVEDLIGDMQQALEAL